MRTQTICTALGRATLALFTLGVLATGARADSVAQVGSSVRISRATAALIDPQGRIGMTTTGSRTAAQPGDVLTYTVSFTPVPNGATRGLGGYITVYIPRNTEVVGARVVNAAGETVPPHRGGLTSDGCGPRGCTGYGLDAAGVQLEEGSLSQLYADTGVFYSTDPRTQRIPHGPGADEFITLLNGIEMLPAPTGINNIGAILESPAPYHAHNQWDWIQAMAFGNGAGTAINRNGDGNTPHLYGSAVAGPQTWYPYEANYTGTVDPGMIVFDPALVVANETVGPWIRVRTLGAEIGRSGNLPPMPDPGIPTRIGVPAIDAGTGTLLGVPLHGGAALPAYDAAAPTDPYTRAVRFAVGELVVGDPYFAEFSLRVLDLPLDPVTGTDVVCAEVTGGDASARDTVGGGGGKDNTWRYFLPAPACVSLELLFDLDVDKLVAVNGDTLTYSIYSQNLATTAHTNVEILHCFDAGNLNYVSSTPMGTVVTTPAGCPAGFDAVQWTIASFDPGSVAEYSADFTITGATRNTVLSRGVFTSTELPAPGFSTVAFTNVDASLVLIDMQMTATPNLVATPPGVVHYAATVSNAGPGTAGAISTTITLPAPFTFTPGTATVGGVPVADPAISIDPGTGDTILVFTAGLPDLSPGGMAGDSMLLEFDADVPGVATPGAYTAGIETWYAAGRNVSDARSGLAEVIVGTVRSEIPVLTGSVIAGTTSITGTTSEPDGTIIRIYINGVEVAQGTATGGTFSVAVPPLSPNERISVSAEAPSELESPRSTEAIVPGDAASVVACNDGVDNDGDGLVDFPDDPDCLSGADISEDHVPLCADGIDNDGDGFTDFGSDPGCRSLLDDDESGGAECADGIDNDGDGLLDFPDDPGCTSADDVSEVDVPACADGLDNDGDGLIDYPADPDCRSTTDGDETFGGTGIPDGGVPDGGVPDGGVPDGGVPDGGGTGLDGGGSGPPDWGGVSTPSDGGCGCRVAGSSFPNASGWLGLIALFGLVIVRRRRTAR